MFWEYINIQSSINYKKYDSSTKFISPPPNKKNAYRIIQSVPKVPHCRKKTCIVTVYSQYGGLHRQNTTAGSCSTES